MNNDLISRSALKEKFDEYIKANPNVSGVFELGKFIIDNAPTVAVDNYSMGYQDGVRKVLSERPKGEWIILVDADNIQTCKCSICGRIADIANREFDKFPYCHCGAKMEGGAE